MPVMSKGQCAAFLSLKCLWGDLEHGCQVFHSRSGRCLHDSIEQASEPGRWTKKGQGPQGSVGSRIGHA